MGYKSIVAILIITIGLIVFVLLPFQQDLMLDSTNVLESGQWIDEVYVDQARYLPGDNVLITAELSNRTDQDLKGEVIFIIKHLSKDIGRIASEKFKVVNGEKSQVTVEWLAPENDFEGYLVEAWFIVGREIKDKMNTAVDVSSDWSKFPRYGYITNFGEMTQEDIQNNIERLNRYHLNGLQFYDWQYKHHQPLLGTVQQPDKKWKDIANRDVYFDTVLDYINQAHDKNMMAMNYNLLFGSYLLSEADGVKSEWGLYKDSKHQMQDGHSLPQTWATTRILLENPENKDWQNYIIQKEREAFEALAFDGWHVDQLGNRGRL